MATRIFRLGFKSEGLDKVFDTASQKVQNFAKNLKSISFQPLLELPDRIEDIGSSVAIIEKQVVSSVNTIANDTIGAFETNTDKAINNLVQSIEKNIARIGVGLLTLGAVVSKSFAFDTLFSGLTAQGATAFSVLETAAVSSFEVIKNTGLSIFDAFTGKVSQLLGELQAIQFIFEGSFALLQQGTFTFGTLIAQTTQLGTLFAQIGLSSAIFGAQLFIARTVFGEITQLAGRLVGRTEANLKPLERLNNIIVTVDLALRNMNITTGALLKTFGLLSVSVGAFFALGPIGAFVGGLATINSLITNIFRIFTPLRLKGLSFFGSARGQIGLIVLGLRNITEKALPALANAGPRIKVLTDQARLLATQVLPLIESRSTAFKLIATNATIAEKGLKKLTLSFSQFQALQAVSRAKLPQQIQFQIFATEVNTFLQRLEISIGRISGILAKVFQISDKEILKIDKDSQQLTNNLNKNLAKTTSIIEKAGSGDKGFKKVLKDIEDVDKRTKGLFPTFQKLGKAIAGFVNRPSGLFGAILGSKTVGVKRQIPKLDTSKLSSTQQKLQTSLNKQKSLQRDIIDLVLTETTERVFINF